ncbi:type I-E CRISPR-associated protein Cas5/CasD [Streptomyces sp. NPDC059991]|uniref:type I-E CRISPR-associated protein Cas5/CasD n=1 Tax=Streptomyces sp. NPDC059991 TaxID=3347028 RepID=UPI00368FC31B
MSVLALRLAGPLQSWALDSRHMIRSTLPYPTKSGVLGLLCAASGIDRGASHGGGVRTADVMGLRLGVRVDQPGPLLVDYHTVSAASHAPLDRDRQRLPTADGGRLKARDSTKITHRHYVADAVFTAYLEGDSDLLARLAHALRRPRYPLFLGRRSCPPSRPVLIGYQHTASLDAVLEHTPWQAAPHEVARQQAKGATQIRLDTVTDDPHGLDILQDQPLPGTPAHRPRYIERPIRHGHITLPVPARQHPQPADATAPVHDPFDLLD